jgi:AcrR family transcriptional regulator
LFGSRGYSGVSMYALAADLGLNQRALYYYFPSKRELFEAATVDAMSRFGAEVAGRVLAVASVQDRVHAYIDLFRHLHQSDPHLVPFIGVVLVDALTRDPQLGSSSGEVVEVGTLVRGFVEVLVDDALARDELEPGVDRDGAIQLLVTIGMGVSLAAIADAGNFPAMLDTLERLHDGTLYRP